MSSVQEHRQYQNELFNVEQKKQKEHVGRIEKIEVRYLGLPEDTTFIMNKGISTPYNCAQRKSNQFLRSFCVRALRNCGKFYLQGTNSPIYYIFRPDLTDIHCKRSVVALIDGKLPWDMHRPLQEICTLQLLKFTDADPHIANK